MNYKLTTFITCIAGSMLTMMLVLGALEPHIDSARMMTIAIFCGIGSAIANIVFHRGSLGGLASLPLFPDNSHRMASSWA
jgi:hypothetical protein